MIVHYFILNVFLITIVTQAAVVDQEPPLITNCPKDFVKDDLTCLEVRVNWQQPTVTDNSGVAPSVTSNRHSGDLFAVPSTSEVIYTATDTAGNTATCSFKITLKSK
ncbi:hyalin-like [Oculina patagonica]